MRSGHNEAQGLFQQLGRQLGYCCRRTWTREHPTDGVWLLDTPYLGHDILPVAALEVAVSEGGEGTARVDRHPGDRLAGPRHPARPGPGDPTWLIRAGATPDAARAHVERLLKSAAGDIGRSRQRIALWTFEQLYRRTRLTVSNPAA